MTQTPSRPETFTPKAVIFDCDGVIVDSEPILFELMQKDFAQYGLPLEMEELHGGFVGGTIHSVYAKAREMGADLPADWPDDFYRRIYVILAEDTPLVPGIPALLDLLDAKGIPYAIGSNGTDEKMQITLGQHPGLIARFRGLLSGQALGKPKPAPDLYLAAAELLGAAPSECIVVEDSVTGARAAQAAGIRCYGYAPHGGGEGLAAVGAIVFADMADLPGLLGL